MGHPERKRVQSKMRHYREISSFDAVRRVW